MNGKSNNLAGGCLIKVALIVGLLVSLGWSLPINEENLSTAAGIVKDSIPTTEKLSADAELADGSLDASGQLRFPPDGKGGFLDGKGGFFQKFGQRLKNKKTTTTTTSTTTPTTTTVSTTTPTTTTVSTTTPTTTTVSTTTPTTTTISTTTPTTTISTTTMGTTSTAVIPGR